MFLIDDHPVREKKFDPRTTNSQRSHHTMTDNFALFMLYRNKERMERGEDPERVPWYLRLFASGTRVSGLATSGSLKG